MIGKKGQVSIFVILGILIVAGVVVYAVSKGALATTNLPSEIQPAYNSFLSCLEEKTLAGISGLESQGGYIYLPEFEAGSDYMPFSSQLNFLGNPIPYWYYVSGNGIPREKVPTKIDMEIQLGEFIEQKIGECSFNSFTEQGFEISLQNPKSARASVEGDEVEVNLDSDLIIGFGDQNFVLSEHRVVVDSDLGNLYDSAMSVYEQEQQELFLEERAVDNLRLYSPVDGVEISCSPKIWNADEVFTELQDSIEANTLGLRSEGDSDDYFVVDTNSDFDVRFINSKDWPSSFEVSPAEGPFLVSNPVGNQQGLGILGFCYVPYHFVYNVRYPVLVQVYSDTETFQFPMAVVLENNNPRVSLNVTAEEELDVELCTYKNTQADVKVIDENGRSVKADISYECFGNRCEIGQTSDAGTLDTMFPQCVNGFVVAKAEGYADSRYLFSTVSGGNVELIMKKLYEKRVQLQLDGANYNGNALVYFNTPDSSTILNYPSQRSVELEEDQYEVIVNIYKNSSINVGATKTQHCFDVAREGVLGIFGLQEKRCFDVEIPAQVVSNSLAGGGKQNYYFTTIELDSEGSLEINSQSLPVANTIEQLQKNYILFDEKKLDINFR